MRDFVTILQPPMIIGGCNMVTKSPIDLQYIVTYPWFVVLFDAFGYALFFHAKANLSHAWA
jgi:hypothetical protein